MPGTLKRNQADAGLLGAGVEAPDKELRRPFALGVEPTILQFPGTSVSRAGGDGRKLRHLFVEVNIKAPRSLYR
ncbi:MAG: hypothetical protein WAX33_10315, partial [Rectinemataceae bacterium]